MTPPPLWPANLHHLAIETLDVERMAAFYRTVLGTAGVAWMDGGAVLATRTRRMILLPGQPKRLRYAAFALADPDRLASFRRDLRAPARAIQSPFFRDGAFAVADPDGNALAFGVPLAHEGLEPDLPGRLQHVVVGSPDCPGLVRFYTEELGFQISDWVRNEGGEATACFLRSDSEHHSLAVFRTDQPRFDHHCYETNGWNDLRDWADHLSKHGHQISWGPGRHGPGDNLFMFVRDPDMNEIEISAELEHMDFGVPPREWPHEERTLNRWGRAYMRS